MRWMRQVRRFCVMGSLALAVGAMGLAGVTGCEAHGGARHTHNGHGGEHGQAGNPWADVSEAVAVVHPTEGNEASGVVRFTQHNDGSVTISARVEGLTPNQRHGFHAHEYGDCTADDATSAGSHYNPEGHPHGLPSERHLHAGDFGNLEADENGVAEFELTVDNVTVAGEHNPLIGRSVIVHAEEDDGSQPLGDAGPRIGCGVIGVANPDSGS